MIIYAYPIISNIYLLLLIICVYEASHHAGDSSGTFRRAKKKILVDPFFTKI